MSVERYPLAWPARWPRSARRLAAPFATFRRGSQASSRTKELLTVGEAVARLLGELHRLGVRSGDVVISSNLRTRLDGLPYSTQAEPPDPGVAVYFRLKAQDRVLACDRYTKVAGNLAALAAHIEALRAIQRYGVGSLDQAFAGYAALPPDPAADWAIVLGVTTTASLEVIEAAYRTQALQAHPDHGGAHVAMARLNAARDAARLARGGA